jgi:hypothetical protein
VELIRVLRTAQVTLSHTFEVDEVPTDAAGAVTVTVARLDGTVVSTGAATHGATGVYTYVLPAQAQLDTLTVDWSGSVGGATVVVRDYVEIVGGFLFGLKQARDMRPPLSPTKYTTAELARTRVEVEQECERICQQAFVPRFHRVALSGTGTSTLATPHANLRVLRGVKVSGVAMSGPELAAVGVSPSGVLTLNPSVMSGAGSWPVGVANIVVEYEYGWDMPPLEISDKAIIRLRSLLTAGDTSVPYRAISFTVSDGGTYRLSTPSKERTGIPDVDATYDRYALDLGGFA